MKGHKGITFVELMVVMAILGIISAAIFTVFKSGFDSWSQATTRLDIFQNARAALEQMTRELASATAVEGQYAFWGRDTETNPEIDPVINDDDANSASDQDPDTVSFLGVIEGSMYEITYRVNNQILQVLYVRDDDINFDYNFNTPAIPTWDELAYNISNLEFEYWKKGTTTEWGAGSRVEWDDSLNPRQDLPQAVRVTLTVTIGIPPNEVSRTFQTVIYLPNS